MHACTPTRVPSSMPACIPWASASTHTRPTPTASDTVIYKRMGWVRYYSHLPLPTHATTHIIGSHTTANAHALSHVNHSRARAGLIEGGRRSLGFPSRWASTHRVHCAPPDQQQQSPATMQQQLQQQQQQQQQQQHLHALQEQQLQECEQLLASAALARSAWPAGSGPTPAQAEQLLRACRTLHTGLATRAAEAAAGSSSTSTSSGSGSSSGSSPEALRLQRLLDQLWDQLRVCHVWTSVLNLHLNYSMRFTAELRSRQPQQQQQQQQPSRAGTRRLPAASIAHLVRFGAIAQRGGVEPFACKLGVG